MHPIAQQEMMSVEKYRQGKQAERSQQINLIAALRPSRPVLAALRERFERLLMRSKRESSSSTAPFEEAVDGA
jgi:hypothetical protein